MPAFLWQNLRREIEDEFARLTQGPLRKALEFYENDGHGHPVLLPPFAIVGSIEAREFWFDRMEYAEGKVSAEWLRQHVPVRVRRDKVKETKRRIAEGLCAGSMSCSEPPVKGARLCHEHLAAARIADLKSRRQAGEKPKKVGRKPYLKDLRERRKAEGKCPHCEEPRVPGKSQCERHREIDRQKAARRRGVRAKLNDLREGLTHHFTVYAAVPSKDPNGPDEIEEIGGYIQTGLYEDGRVGEIFLKIGKPGDRFAMLDQWAMAFSFALQYGAPLEELCRKFAGSRFEPSGATRNKDIPRCTSLVDYAARWLLSKYVPVTAVVDDTLEEWAQYQRLREKFNEQPTEGEEWVQYQRLKKQFESLEAEMAETAKTLKKVKK